MQISDCRIRCAAAPNTDTPGTLREAIGLVAVQKRQGAALILHTGDVSQLPKPAQVDTAQQIIREVGLDAHHVPGEHDVLIDDRAEFFQRFTPGAPRGWYSFGQQGARFIGLNNVQDLKAGGLGNLGAEQLAWLERDPAGRAASQPIVVFAHVPLWLVSAEWGWGTDDGAQALGFLRRFDPVTVLNGHIHQVMQKVEGNLAFHTAFPQPALGTAPSPGPIRDLPAGRLRATLGVTRIARVEGRAGLAIADTPLGA
ncbi:metallophosphoesterase family protein [Dankookia rubra]|uniref:metallophosphoesterase family protein n=1 Tax=Dankookia rubra TaxID=1442381 RepID=UPI0019D6399A|nr:metallophosphoesterase [Dankookia rubra]